MWDIVERDMSAAKDGEDAADAAAAKGGDDGEARRPSDVIDSGAKIRANDEARGVVDAEAKGEEEVESGDAIAVTCDVGSALVRVGVAAAGNSSAKNGDSDDAANVGEAGTLDDPTDTEPGS
jgi:hypothetical protein